MPEGIGNEKDCVWRTRRIELVQARDDAIEEVPFVPPHERM